MLCFIILYYDILYYGILYNIILYYRGFIHILPDIFPDLKMKIFSLKMKILFQNEENMH